jgi:acyl dehydratase
MRHYEDLVVGETRLSAPRTLTREEMLEFARRYDPQYFHTDVEAAKESIFGEVIASGIYTMAIWRQLDHGIASDIRWICGIAWDDVRWPLAVRSGNTLRARYTILSKRESTTHPERGIISIRYEMINQDDRLVWSARGTNLIERRPAAAGCETPAAHGTP